ncbi:hypothetical protein [Mycobacterium sp. 1274756.6]|uniref:hypothetical protein n=1 Tax=Mycobacterium sp. 1274756.6 TaxID=1834076 RepID=UPI0008005548|nr:hypothetical protein [Mycobacterium sp. 1274756.6]OBJ69793.1 hypothetical protein A5643_11725 [Mycobacterium sp. 1274756.6]
MKRVMLWAPAIAAAVALPLLSETPPVGAAPTTDARGYVNSSARCDGPAVLFGSTASSRVAICGDADAGYEYRGVRLSDGAALTLPATASDSGAYTATNDGVTYTVSAKTLRISAGSTVLRSEPMLDVHGDTDAPATETPAATPADTPTPSTPLPPPLAAEEGYTAS